MDKEFENIIWLFVDIWNLVKNQRIIL
jgi:uncharacterized membrane protein